MTVRIKRQQDRDPFWKDRLVQFFVAALAFTAALWMLSAAAPK